MHTTSAATAAIPSSPCGSWTPRPGPFVLIQDTDIATALDVVELVTRSARRGQRSTFRIEVPTHLQESWEEFQRGVASALEDLFPYPEDLRIIVEPHAAITILHTAAA